MDKNELMTKVVAVLTTLVETNSGSPESMLYIGVCGMDMDKWMTLREILIKTGFVTIRGNYVTLTKLGKETGEKLNTVLARK